MPSESIPLRPAGSFAPWLIAQLVDDILAIPEIRALQPLEGIIPIEKAPPCRELQHAKGAHDTKPLVSCNSDALAVVQKKELGVKCCR